MNSPGFSGYSRLSFLLPSELDERRDPRAIPSYPRGSTAHDPRRMPANQGMPSMANAACAMKEPMPPIVVAARSNSGRLPYRVRQTSSFLFMARKTLGPAPQLEHAVHHTPAMPSGRMCEIAMSFLSACGKMLRKLECRTIRATEFELTRCQDMWHKITFT